MRLPNSIGQGRGRRPEKIYFEVTNRCNFRCDFCAIRVSGRPAADMDFGLLEKGIEEVAHDRLAASVGFHVLGEPLLYPRIAEAIALARGRGLRTELTTNGWLLTPGRVASLAEAGLDALSISLQTDETEHASRGSAVPFDRYHRRVLDAVAAAHRGGRMEITLSVMDTSTRALYDLDGRWRLSQGRAAYRRKVRRVALDTCAAIGAAPPVPARFSPLSLAVPRLIRLDPRVALYAQPLADWGNAFTRHAVRPARFGTCGYALRNVAVLATGEVTICCADYDGRTSLGNLNRDSLAHLLASPAAAAIGRGFARWRPVHPYCRRCLGGVTRSKALLRGIASIYLFAIQKFRPARAAVLTPLPTGQSLEGA